MMNLPPYPYLTVTSPNQDETYRINFSDFFKTPGMDLRVTLGRGEANHIDLPDPYKKISRRQCVFEQCGSSWFLVDEGSANGTYVRRSQDPDLDEIDARVGKVDLEEEDVILILGAWKGEDTPLFWRLVWHDPDFTVPQPGFSSPEFLEYHLPSQQLYRIKNGVRTTISLSKQQRSLVNYLASCNAENDGHPAICSSQELLMAIWEEPFGHKISEVNRLAWAIRNKIESDGGEPRWLLNHKGEGYSLRVKILD